MATTPSSAQTSPARRWVIMPSWRPMRNLALTGTPYGAAAPTAARTTARSSAGRAGTAAPPPLRVTLAAGQPKLRSMWSTRPGVAHAGDRPAHHLRVRAVDLQAARVLVGIERDHPLGLGVAVHEGGRHHHLVDVDEPRTEAPAEGAERRVGHARHRRQHHRHPRHERPVAQLHACRGYRPPSIEYFVHPSASGRSPIAHQRTTMDYSTTSLRLGWAPSSSGVGPSRRRRCQPAAAIIAALSVHMACPGR